MINSVVAEALLHLFLSESITGGWVYREGRGLDDRVVGVTQRLAGEGAGNRAIHDLRQLWSNDLSSSTCGLIVMYWLYRYVTSARAIGD